MVTSAARAGSSPGELGCSCRAGRALLRFPGAIIETSRFLISFSFSLSPRLRVGVLQSLIEIVKRPVTALAFLPDDQSRPRAGRARQQCASWPGRGGHCGTEGLGLPGEARGRAPWPGLSSPGRGDGSWTWTVTGKVCVSPSLDVQG